MNSQTSGKKQSAFFSKILPIFLLFCLVITIGYVFLLQNKVAKLEKAQSLEQSRLSANIQELSEKINTLQASLTDSSNDPNSNLEDINAKIEKLNSAVNNLNASINTRIDQKLTARDALIDGKIEGSIEEAITDLKFQLSRQGINLNREN